MRNEAKRKARGSAEQALKLVEHAWSEIARPPAIEEAPAPPSLPDAVRRRIDSARSVLRSACFCLGDEARPHDESARPEQVEAYARHAGECVRSVRDSLRGEPIVEPILEQAESELSQLADAVAREG